MKRFLLGCMALCMAAGMLWGCGKNTANQGSATLPPVSQTAPEQTVIETAPASVPAPAPLELLEKVWASYNDEERFPAMGGDMEAQIMNAPGEYDMKLSENLVYLLLVPQERVEQIEQTATLIHMMNANSFTCGVFRLKQGVSAQEFAEGMKQSVLGNRWMCGFPDRMRVAVFGEDTVLVAYGVEEMMGTFNEKLSAAYGDQMTVFADEQIL